MAWVFTKKINEKIIDNLLKEKLWEKLLIDCEKGEIFLAIRWFEITFYYKGRGFFHYNKKGFKTDKEYYKNFSKEEYYDQYEQIKKNCENYAIKNGKEGLGVSYLYKNSTYFSNDPVVLLDIEVGFKKENKKRNRNKIDILLYNKNVNQLMFIEAKRLDDERLRKPENKPEVITQINEYKYLIEKHLEELKSEYYHYIKILNKLFENKINISITDENNKPSFNKNKISLIIFEYNKEQIKEINSFKNSNLFDDIPIYSIDDPKLLNAVNIWNEVKYE